MKDPGEKMKKRAFCFLAAAVLLLLLLPAPALACDHTDEDGEPLKYVRKGYVAPQIGVPGYSGDLCCPKCGAVVIKGETLPALENPAGPGSGTDPDPPQKTEAPKPTEKPTSAPTDTPKPTKAPTPEPTATPQPTKAPTPTPTATPKPTKALTPEPPATPKLTKAPMPEPTTVPKPTATPKLTEKPTPEPTKVPKVTKPPKKTRAPENTKKPASTGPGKRGRDPAAADGTLGRERFSERFPYRRVRMRPEEGIRAEGAGILVWPAAISPFQSMFD